MRKIIVTLILSFYCIPGLAFVFGAACGENNLEKCQTSLKNKFDKICSITVPACQQQSLYTCVVESDNCSFADDQGCPVGAETKSVQLADNKTHKYCVFNKVYKSSVACTYTKGELVNRALTPYQEKASQLCRRYIQDRNCILSSIWCDQPPKSVLSRMKYNFKKRHKTESDNLDDRVVSSCEVTSPNCSFTTADSPQCEKGLIPVALANRKEKLCRNPAVFTPSPGPERQIDLTPASTR